MVSDRFGLGDRLTTANIDKWTLYPVAQYAIKWYRTAKAEVVANHDYTCNVYVQERNDAYTVLRDLQPYSVGMTCWGDDQIVALADAERCRFAYTHANVIDGRYLFNSTTKNRYQCAGVWSDPDSAYSDAMEPVLSRRWLRVMGLIKPR